MLHKNPNLCPVPRCAQCSKHRCKRIAVPPSEWEGALARRWAGRASKISRRMPHALRRLAEAPGDCRGAGAGPDVLLLDEPTNHLDLSGIEWLEGLLKNAPFACVVVSHDRYFLENVATEMVELNRAYPDGLLRVNGTTAHFWKRKKQFLEAHRSGRTRLRIACARRSSGCGGGRRHAPPSQRPDRSGSRTDRRTGGGSARNRTATAAIEFSATGRQTKRLVELEDLKYELRWAHAVRGPEFVLTAGMRVGLVGPNGSGKTTLLRLLRGEIEPIAGGIKRATALRIVYFDQNRMLEQT